MGFRVPQTRELDPQVPLVRQETMLNPYFNQMMQRDENSLNRQLQLMQKKGEYDAAKEAANIERSGAWTKGLDAFTKSAIPAAQSIHGMRIANRQATEQEKSGEVNRLNTMENALSTRQGREMDAAYAPREREAGLGQTLANTKMIGSQTTGQDTANESAKIKLDQEKAQVAFEQADAAAYGFQNARPGENVAQYTMRMNAEGKIADVEKVKAESAKMKMDMEYMPERLRLEKLQTLAGIEASRASAANARTMASVAVAGSNREQERHQIEQINAKTAIADKNIQDFAKGVMSGTIGGKNLSPDDQAGMIAFHAQDQMKQLGMAGDARVLTARAITGAVSDQRSAAIAARAADMLDPVIKQEVDRNLGQIRLANAGSVLIKGLTAKLEKYQNSNVIMNSEEAKLAAETIRSDLQQAAAQDERFKPYLEQFDKINAGLGAGGFLGIDTLRNLTGPAPAKQVESLIEVISGMIQTELDANPVVHPSAAAALDLAKQNMGNANNFFLDAAYRRNQQQQQQMPQPAPQRPFYSPVQVKSPVNQPRNMQELDQMFPQARR